MKNRFKKGDVIIWRRSDGPVEAKVLEARNGSVNLAVDGWLGTTWEKEANHAMWLAKEWVPDSELRREILRRFKNNIQLSAAMLAAIRER